MLYATASHPILGRNGTPAPWMLYTWAVTLTGDGLVEAGQALLDRLSTFRSTQLAAHGLTGLPLVAACVALSGGRFHGLAIRKERKTYLSGRRIEGPIDHCKTVVVIDDSISSGTALADSIKALEAEGLEVEGAIVLVSFPNRGGMEWANQRGYRVEALFDIATDLGMPLHQRTDRRRPSPPRAAATPVCPDGTHPAELARAVARHYLATNSVPGPPGCLDQPYDGRGGVFVSFRRIVDDHRLARDGYWHWDPASFDPPTDVVQATVAALRHAAPGDPTR